MLVRDKDGWVSNSRVVREPREAIEHGPLGSVSALVLHRTGSVTASSVLNAWKTKREGTHFLVSENGKVYQTASLRKACWHVGKIYSRCRSTASCSSEEAATVEEMLSRRGTSWGGRFRLVTKHELKKSYPVRFPHNHDSIGVEIVGQISSDTELYELPNKVQLSSVFWIIDQIVATY